MRKFEKFFYDVAFLAIENGETCNYFMNILNDSKNEMERRQLVSRSTEGDNDNENLL